MSIRPRQPSTGTLASPVAENRLAAVLAAGHKAKDKFRTGTCLTVTSPKVITARLYINLWGSLAYNTNFQTEYTLTELDCADHSTPKVSMDEAIRVFNWIRMMANGFAGKYEGGEMKVQMKTSGSEQGYIATLKYDTSNEYAAIISYLDDEGYTVQDYKETDAFSRLQNYLSENYDKPDRPLFLLDGAPMSD